jgi:hypothetical protein
MPTLVSASRTSSSLNGLMIAITIFMKVTFALRSPALWWNSDAWEDPPEIGKGIQAPCQLAVKAANRWKCWCFGKD